MLGSPVDLSAIDRRQLPDRRDHRPHLPVAELLPLHRPAGREQTVRAVDQRAHRRDGEPARQRQGQVPGGQGLPGGPGRRPPHAETCHGSWWPDHAAWLAERCGAEAPAQLSSAAGWRRSATRREPTSMTADPAERVQMLTAGGRVLRVATRDGNPDQPPLLLCNGIGGRLELFGPFVDALDPRRAIIRFDMPGIGESPAPVVPLPPGCAGAAADRASRPARRRAGPRRHLLGRWARPAIRVEPAGPGTPPGTGRHRAGRAHGARASESAAAGCSRRGATATRGTRPASPVCSCNSAACARTRPTGRSPDCASRASTALGRRSGGQFREVGGGSSVHLGDRVGVVPQRGRAAAAVAKAGGGIAQVKASREELAGGVMPPAFDVELRPRRHPRPRRSGG